MYTNSNTFLMIYIVLDREGKFGVTMAPNRFLIRTAQEWIPEMHTLGTITSNGKEGDL